MVHRHSPDESIRKNYTRAALSPDLCCYLVAAVVAVAAAEVAAVAVAEAAAEAAAAG